jgi:hypothetical protein
MPERGRFGVGRPHHESIAYALLTWRKAEETLRQPFLDEQRPEYERAIAEMLGALRAADSVADLMACYALDRRAVHAVTGVGGPPGGDGPQLLPALVEGAAFWRRLRELVAAAVG